MFSLVINPIARNHALRALWVPLSHISIVTEGLAPNSQFGLFPDIDRGYHCEARGL
jgi:hypothetical protein